MTRSPIPPPKPRPVVEHNRAANWLLLLAALLMAAALYWSNIDSKDQKMLLERIGNTPTPDHTATPALGLNVAAPLSAFPDGGAFLVQGNSISLSGYVGGMMVVTTEARVAAVATGTPPAVLLDVPEEAATAVQALLANPTPGVLQYIPATVTHTPVPEPTTLATPEP